MRHNTTIIIARHNEKERHGILFVMELANMKQEQKFQSRRIIDNVFDF